MKYARENSCTPRSRKIRRVHQGGNRDDTSTTRRSQRRATDGHDIPTSSRCSATEKADKVRPPLSSRVVVAAVGTNPVSVVLASKKNRQETSFPLPQKMTLVSWGVPRVGLQFTKSGSFALHPRWAEIKGLSGGAISSDFLSDRGTGVFGFRTFWE